jgi:hypothetical protein
MGKLRSPNCPTMTLMEALDRGRKVYSEEHTHAADRKVIAEDLGYSGISGASATAIGALRQYGVLEGRGDGLRISDDAVAVFELPKDSADYFAALRRMAFRPALFEEFHEQFGDRLPGEANLRHTLIKKGFLPATADEVIRTYRDNLTLVNEQPAGYNQREEEQKPMQEAEQSLYISPSKAAKMMPKPLATQVLAISIPRNLSVDIAVKGDELKREDIAKIKSQFNRWIEGLEEAFEE